MSLSLAQALEMAEQALEDGELDDASVLADQALALAPNDVDALEIKGLALGELGDYEAADAVFEKLLKPRALVKRGSTFALASVAF
jgi:tetratricopeptide (TPR) repeat protein